MKKIFAMFLILYSMLSPLICSSVKIVDLEEKNNYNLTLRSVLYPGLGQIYMGYETKGYLFATLTTFCIIGSIYSYNAASSNYNSYFEAGCIDNGLYDDYKSRMNDMYLCVGVGLLFWIYNIYDTYKTADKYLYDADNKIKMSFYDKKIYLSYVKTY